MNKKILSALLLAAFTFASTSMFVSCKDYDDDISGLKSQISELSNSLANIQENVNNGAILTSVTPTTGGVTIALSNGKTFTITNGKDGADGADGANGANGADGVNGTAWQIGADGYWYYDKGEGLVKTDFYALGTKGEKGDQGEKGADGADGKDGANGADGKDGVDGTNGAAAPAIYYVPNAETGCWDIYKDGALIEHTSISFISESSADGVITAVKSEESLVLYGVDGGEGAFKAFTVSLNALLKSMVFMPKYYFDGIETIIYPWLHDTIMTQPKNPVNSFQRQRASESEVKTINLLGLIKSANDEYSATVDWWGNYYLPQVLLNANGEDYRDYQNYLPDSYTFSYGLPISVDYHLNPANSKVEYADVKGWSVLTPEVINYHTRAAAASDFSSPEKNFRGDQLFNCANGIISAGLQIANPQNLNPYPTVDVFNDPGKYNNNNIVALQVNTTEDIVTSDYALIYPEKYWVEGLAYKKMQTYTTAIKNAQGVWTGNNVTTTSNYAQRVSAGTRQGDLDGTLCNKRVHVWDTPMGALKDPDGAALEVAWNDSITLRDYLEIHLAKDVVSRMNPDYSYPTEGPIKLDCSKKEEEVYGLKLEFKLVNYAIAGNKTHDSKYAQLADNYNGKVIPFNVDTDGKTIFTKSETSIDREPLVQVLVKNTKGEVVLDGYILLHICALAPEPLPNKDIIYPAGKHTFDLCNDGVVLTTTWSQFSKIALTDTLKNMTKEDFDAMYEVVNPTGVVNYDGPYTFYEVDQWNEAWKDLAMGDKFNPETVWAGKIGNIYYYPNWQGTTNHVFKWVIPAEELEALTHDQAKLPVTVSRWVRYQINYADPLAAASAPYPYIYVQLTATIDRKPFVNDQFGVKNDNYWYDWQSGATDGWSSVVVDIQEPRNGENISGPFVYTFHESLVKNIENTSGTASDVQSGNNLHKYYFAPKDMKVTGIGPDGKTTSRIITAQSSALDVDYITLYCKYVNDSHKWDEATLDNTLQNCAIDYGKGAFNNKYLYSKNGSIYTKIAEIDQKTGEVTLLNTPDATFEEAKLVLNLVGYTEKHANINTELRTWGAIVSSNECGLAKPVTYEKTPELKSFMYSWQRPINLQQLDNQYALDAHTNGNVIYLIDLLKLFDWRGNNSEGKMYDGQYWFWAYYLVNKITIDMDPAHIYTDMHYNDWSKTMADVTNLAELRAWPSGNKSMTTYDFGSLINSYNDVSKEGPIEMVMGINPVNNLKKEKFGAIKYINNGGNVTKFSVRIPIILEYYWGKIYDTVEIEIDATAGNH